MKILILILTITPTIALSQINLDDWKTDVRYSYETQENTLNSIKSIATQKTISANLYLDSSLDENTSINGVFTTSDVRNSDSNMWKFYPVVEQKFVRQLYVTHKTEDGTNIKAGRLSSEFDKSKLVQSLDANCDGDFGVICDGLDSIYINTEVDKSTSLEFLASNKTYFYADINTYAASIKHTIKDNDYYFRIFQGDYNHKTFPFLDSDTLTLSMSGEFAVNDSHDKLKVALRYSDYEYDTDINSTEIYHYSRTNNAASLGISSLIFVNDFKIIPSVSYARWSNDYTANNVSTQTFDSTPAKMITNHVGVNIEYPIQKGRLSFSRFIDRQTNTALAGDSLQDLKINSTQASVLYNLNKNISLKLNYEIFNVSGSDSNLGVFYNNVYEQDSKITNLETVYKF